MAQGNGILINGIDPKGRQIEGIISGTPKPGTLMEIVPGTAPVNGRHTWRVWSGASGAKQLIVVLLEDAEQGKLSTDAYVTATRAKLYIPVPGDELNMLMADVAGTADDHAIGDLLGAQTATGKLIVNSSFAFIPFTCMETITDPVADQLVWCIYNG